MWSWLFDKASIIKNDPKNDYYKYIKDKMQLHNKETIFNYITMSYILEENYRYIKDTMNLKGMNRVINVNNVYYKPCMEANKLLKFKPKSILFNYNRYYPEVKFPSISSAIMELISIGLFEYKNGYLMGSEYHLNEMLAQSPTTQTILA